MSGRTALLAGATGLVGGHLLRLLLCDATYGRVVVYTRRPLGVEHPKLAALTVNFDDLAAAPSAGADDVFCCLGTTIKRAGSREAFFRVDVEYVVALAERGRRDGAGQFLLVSAVGADSRSRNFYLRTKGEAERRVADAGYPITHVFRPSVLLGERTERRLLEGLSIAVLRAGNWTLTGALRRYRGIEARTVAAAMLGAALSPSSGLNIHHHDEMQRLAERMAGAGAPTL